MIVKININDIKALNELQKELNINDEVLSYICAMATERGSIKASKDLLTDIVNNCVGSEDLLIYNIDGIGTVLNLRYGYNVWDAQYLSFKGLVLEFSKDV